MLYSAGVISAIQRHDSATVSYVPAVLAAGPAPSPSQACRLAPSPGVTRVTEQIPPGSHCQCVPPCSYLRLPRLPRPCPQVCSPCLCLRGCPADSCIVPSFWVPRMCVTMRCLLVSFWLTSLCASESGFTASSELTRTRSSRG